MEKQLAQLGFNKNEIKVYLAFFELGKVRAGEIISHTKLHRNLVYQSLEKLLEKTLISKVIVKGVAVFEANDPTHLVNLMEEQKDIAKKISEQLKQRQKQKPRDIKIYDGLEGVERVRNQVLQTVETGDKFHVIGASQYGTGSESEDFIKKFNKKLINKGVDLKILFDRFKGDELIQSRGLEKNIQAKLLPFGANIPMWVAFYKDTLDISVGKKDMATFSIRSREAVEAFEKYFKYFWEQDVVVETGLVALEKFIYEMLDELEPGEEYFVLGASVGVAGDPGQKLYDRFHKDRIKKGVITNMLVYQESYDLIKERFIFSGDEEGKISHVKKFISATPNPMQINMYNGKTRFIIYGEEPVVIYIDRPEIHDAFKSYFNNLWHQDMQILSGPEVIKNIWLESLQTKELKFIGARGYFVDRHPKMFDEIKSKAENISGLKWKNVVDIDSKNHPLNKLPWMEARYNIKGSKNPNVIWLWGNKVAVANWTEDEPVVLISENKHMVQSYQDYFDELWDKKF